MNNNTQNKREAIMLLDEMTAIRTATAFSSSEHVTALRLSGDSAFDIVDQTCSCDLYLQDAQMRFAVLLDQNGNTRADIYVCRDDEDYIVLAEGISREALIDVFRAPDRQVEVRDLHDEYDMISLHGPFAWELFAEFAGPDVIGLPYLSLFHLDSMICFRGGKTGEYGYDMLIPKQDVPSVVEKMETVGRAFDLQRVSLESVDLCSFENWFFNARKEGQMGLSPLELGLQWRVSYGKEYIGSSALVARRQAGAKQRSVCAISRSLLSTSAEVVSPNGTPIGRVLRSEHSPIIDACVNMVLLDVAYAYSGIDSYSVMPPGDGPTIPILTVSPPVINNRSLYVNAQKHSYAARETYHFPALV